MSESTARPTWALTVRTPGIDRSSRVAWLAIRFIAGCEVPGAASTSTSRSRSWSVGMNESVLEREEHRQADQCEEAGRERTRAADFPRAATAPSRSRVAIAPRSPIGVPSSGELGSSMTPSAGVTVSATIIEATTARQKPMATGCRNAPVGPAMKNAGMAISSRIIVAYNIVPRISSAASRVIRANDLLLDACRCCRSRRTMFSTLPSPRRRRRCQWPRRGRPEPSR